MAMTEAQAITQIDSDALEAANMAASVTAAYDDMDDTAALLTGVVTALESKLAILESNIDYAIREFL